MQYTPEYLINKVKESLVEQHCDECGCSFQGSRVEEDKRLDELRGLGYDVKLVTLCNDCYLKHHDDQMLKVLMDLGADNEAKYMELTRTHAFIKIRQNTWCNKLLQGKYKTYPYEPLYLDALIAHHQGKQSFHDEKGGLRVVKDFIK